MGVEKQTITAGGGTTFPKAGDKLSMHYTGTLTNGCECLVYSPLLPLPAPWNEDKKSA